MAVVLTCDCGARFTVEDILAGREVSCPECHQTLRAPARDQITRRTSTLAVLSAVLALVGAFTVVGTAAAVVVGLVALGVIVLCRDRLTGYGYAAFGVVAGLAFTGLTLLALSQSNRIGLGAWMRARQMAGQLRTDGPTVVERRASGFAITRPAEEWGLVQGASLDDPAVDPLHLNLDLLLADPRRFAFVDVRVDAGQKAVPVHQCLYQVFEHMRDLPPPDPYGWRDPELRPKVLLDEWQFQRRRLETEGGLEGLEAEGEVRCGARRWHFLIRLYKRQGGDLYVVRAYAPRPRFEEAREELTRALDHFKVLGRAAGPPGK